MERAVSARRAAPAQARPATRVPGGAPRRRRPTAAAGARVALERLWAPWRMAYIGRANESSECLFCRVARARAGDDRRLLVLARRPHAYLMLNRYPYTGGHLMVAVGEHRARFARLTVEERADLFELVALAERALETEYHPHGMNLGVNVGRVAGAGFPGHLHVHVVPRWDGDTNFMAAVGETRVLPESLARTWARLRRAIRTLGPEQGGRRRTRGPKG
jgi:ATP adenylyltransferase